jgi:zinc finger SWIM domain-containing protein 3
MLTNTTGSFINLETTPLDEDTKFHRLFISFHASINGFVHCGALLGLDRTHLTSKYGGILLAATGLDARG